MSLLNSQRPSGVNVQPLTSRPLSPAPAGPSVVTNTLRGTDPLLDSILAAFRKLEANQKRRQVQEPSKDTRKDEESETTAPASTNDETQGSCLGPVQEVIYYTRGEFHLRGDLITDATPV